MSDAALKAKSAVDTSGTDAPPLPTVKFAINVEKSSSDRRPEDAVATDYWSKLAQLHRLHILASAASGVPYDPKLLEQDDARRKEKKIDGEDLEACQTDAHVSAAVEDDDDDDEDDVDDAPTASSNTYIKSAIPFLPRGVAVLCLLLNIIIPGTGTVLSGLSVFCCGQPRIPKVKDGLYTSTFCINLMVGVMQLFTITFLLVGWIWSLVWGIYLVVLAVEQSKREKAKHKNELKVRALTALNSRLRAWSLRQPR